MPRRQSHGRKESHLTSRVNDNPGWFVLEVGLKNPEGFLFHLGKLPPEDGSRNVSVRSRVPGTPRQVEDAAFSKGKTPVPLVLVVANMSERRRIGLDRLHQARGG